MRSRVLVVDDNRELAENLGEILEDEGCEVALAYSGEEALKVADAGRFDLVLADIRMPGISGVELVRALSRRHPEARFLLMTAYTSEPQLLEARTLGSVLAVLAKPLALEQLLAMLPREAGARVLLVEGDPALAAMLGDSMRARGYAVEVAGGVAAARASLTRARPDLAVIDLVLPDGSGEQLARELCGEAPGAASPIPVVVIGGGRESAGEALRGPALRRVQVLSKPLAAETLLSALEAAAGGG